jgi:DNA-binding NtrC family response regulator
MSPLNMEVSGVRGSGVYSRRNREPPKLTHYVFAYLTKPFKVAEMLATIRRAENHTEGQVLN